MSNQSSEAEETALNLNLSLRKAGHPAALVTAVVQWAQLRSKARTKFGAFADRMAFTPAGLEQAIGHAFCRQRNGT